MEWSVLRIEYRYRIPYSGSCRTISNVVARLVMLILDVRYLKIEPGLLRCTVIALIIIRNDSCDISCYRLIVHVTVTGHPVKLSRFCYNEYYVRS